MEAGTEGGLISLEFEYDSWNMTVGSAGSGVQGTLEPIYRSSYGGTGSGFNVLITEVLRLTHGKGKNETGI